MKHPRLVKKSLLLLILLPACGTEHMPVASLTDTVSTKSAAATSAADAPTYWGQIRPIFEARCKTCHGSGPVRNWLDYSQAAAAKDKMMDRVIVKKNMPLGAALTSDDISLIEKWILAGAPEGTKTPETKPDPKPEPKPVPEPTPDPIPDPVPDPAPVPEPGTDPVPTPTDPMDGSKLTWDKDIYPIIENRCTMCHNEDSATSTDPIMPNWKLYSEVYDKRELIIERLINSKGTEKQMPPEGNDIDQAERDIIEAWIKAGAKQGAQ